jgi:hypothetical protein
LSEQAEVEPDADLDWSRTVTLKIAAYPGLSENQRRVVELDYAMVHGVAEVIVKTCMLFHNLKRLGLDIAPDTRRPQDQHIVLMNPAEVQGFLGQIAQ